MEANPLPRHWSFAFAVARETLNELLWYFDLYSEKMERGFPILDVPNPGELLQIVDGFVNDGRLPQGDITNLSNMRAQIEGHLMPSYNLGEEEADRRWDQASFDERAKLEAMGLEDMHNAAKASAPESL